MCTLFRRSLLKGIHGAEPLTLKVTEVVQTMEKEKNLHIIIIIMHTSAIAAESGCECWNVGFGKLRKIVLACLMIRQALCLKPADTITPTFSLKHNIY